jgi:uncharacterized protein YlaN (UPF0358 family)
MKIKKERKMFNVTVTDEMNESIAMFAANAEDLLKLIKKYTSAKSLDSTPLYSINIEIMQ